MAKEESKFMVVAIDFGSTGAGCAFSYAYQYRIDPLNMNTSVWPDNNSGMSKVPCVILFDPNKNFKAFGNEAEGLYETLVDEGANESWYYFRGFKMQLYKAVQNDVDVREDFKLSDVSGKAMSAKKVFASAIESIMDVLKKQIKQRDLGTIDGLEHYVLTVPAIWNDSCKQFMREAAEKAGISSDRLSMVYEPEAASIYAMHLPVQKLNVSSDKVILQVFNPGRKFIVVDAGGGTVDISTQEVSEIGQLKIIHKFMGGPWGGECTNNNFLQLLSKIVGLETLKQYKKYNSRDFFELLRNFESKKKTFKFAEQSDVRISVPYTFSEYITDATGKDLKDFISCSEYNEILSVKRDKIVLKQELFVDLFRTQIGKIVADIRNILENERCSNVSAIMMVGGLAESEVLQNAIKNEFRGPDIEVYIPVDGGLSVLKGSVVYGHNPAIVTSRICPFTYGVDVAIPFDPLCHPTEKKTIVDGRIHCSDIFDVLYVDGEEVKVGEKRSINIQNSYYMPDSQRLRFLPKKIDLYSSTLKAPFFTTDEGCVHQATIVVPVPKSGKWPKLVNGTVELEIAGTEMIGTYVNDDTQEHWSIRFEFMPTTSKIKDRKRLFDPLDTTDIEVDFDI